MRLRMCGCLSALVLLSTTAFAGIEGFEDVSTLPGAGWTLINNSTAGGSTSWFQGDPVSSLINAQAGPANSYISANFNNAPFGGSISNWLILPQMMLVDGDTLTFWTRTETNPFPGDNLEVRLSTNGASSNVGAGPSGLGDFSALLTSVNTPYPQDWTLVTAVITGVPVPTNVRLALRYVVADTAEEGDIIGIDTLGVTSSVPEPSAPILLSAGLALIALGRLRYARRA